MISKRRFSTSSFLSLLLLALASGATAVWALSGSRSDTEIEYRAKEARYQSQIKSLKLALQSNGNVFDRERHLAARLQRELQDANRQIDDLARKLGIAQQTISEKNLQLKKAKLTRGAGLPDSNSKHAHIETTSALIVSRAAAELGLPQDDKRLDRTVSRYSPSQAKRVKSRIDQQRHKAALARRSRLPVASHRRNRVDVRVSGVGPIRAGRRTDQSQTWPLSKQVSSYTQRTAVGHRERRLANAVVVPPTVVVPRPAQSRVRGAQKARRVAAVNRRQVRRRARYARYSRLGRLNKRRKRRVVRYRKPRGKIFGYMTRQEVFKQGYYD